MDRLIAKAKADMEKTTQIVQKDIAAFRTGRASPALVENLDGADGLAGHGLEGGGHHIVSRVTRTLVDGVQMALDEGDVLRDQALPSPEDLPGDPLAGIELHAGEFCRRWSDDLVEDQLLLLRVVHQQGASVGSSDVQAERQGLTGDIVNTSHGAERGGDSLHSHQLTLQFPHLLLQGSVGFR